MRQNTHPRISTIGGTNGVTASADIIDKFQPYKTQLQNIKKYVEATGYNACMSDGDKSSVLISKVVQPLQDQITDIRSRISSASTKLEDKMTYGEAVVFMEADLEFAKKRLNDTAELYAEASFWGDIAPYQQAVMPWQYLETISNNAKYVVNFENTSTPTIPMVRKVRYVEAGGKEWKLPFCYKDGAFWEALLGTGNLDFSKKVALTDVTDGAFNLVTAQDTHTGKQSGKDPLVPFVTITTVDIDNAAGDGVIDIPIPQTQELTADLHSRGKFHTVVKYNRGTTQAPDNVTISISGKVNFRTGLIEVNTTGPIKTITWKSSFSGETMKELAEMRVEQEDHYITIQKRIHMGMTFEKGQNAAKMSLENIDPLVEGIAIMHELADGAKDYSVFEHIDDVAQMMTDGLIDKGKESGNNYFAIDYNDAPTSEYSPHTPLDWREKMIPESIDKVGTKFKKHFNSTKGILSVVYGDPELTRQIPETRLIIASGLNYGGVKNEGEVFTAKIGKNSYRIIDTERRPYEEGGDENTLRMVPKSGLESQKTFSMYQWISYLTKDGSYRSSTNPLLPAAIMVDNFDVDHVHAVVGDVKFIPKA